MNITFRFEGGTMEIDSFVSSSFCSFLFLLIKIVPLQKCDCLS